MKSKSLSSPVYILVGVLLLVLVVLVVLVVLLVIIGLSSNSV